MEDIKIIAMADASLKPLEEKVAPVEGRVIFLSNGTNVSSLEWKARKIPQVCDSIKTAKTRATDKVMDDTIYFTKQGDLHRNQVFGSDTSCYLHR